MESKTEDARNGPRRVKTACTLDCPDACALDVEVEGGRILRVSGVRGHPYTEGFTCAKIRRFPARLVAAERQTRPLLRKAGRLCPVSWSEAMERVADALQSCIDEHRPILHFRGGANKGCVKYVEDRFFAALGAMHVDSACCCDHTGIEAFIQDFGALEMSDPRLLCRAKRIVIWGRRLRASSVHMAAWVSRARQAGARVLSIGPRAGENVGLAERSIRLAPGTDRFLALAGVHALLRDEGRRRRLRAEGEGGRRFLAFVEGLDPHLLLKGCDVSPNDLRRLVEIYEHGEELATVVGNGLQRCRWGGASLRAIDALAWVSGGIGGPGGGVFYSTPSGRAFDRSWVQKDGYGARLSLGRLGAAMESDRARPGFMWISQGNPVNQLPEGKRLAKACREGPFTVVVDAFLTDTARIADCFLPCQLLFEEEEDVVGAWGHHGVQRVRRVVEPPAGCRSDLEILRDLSRRLDEPIDLPLREEALEASLRGGMVDLSLEELRERAWTVASHPTIAFPEGCTAHGDGRFHPMTECPGLEEPSISFPEFRLLSLIRRRFLHSQILESEHASLEPECFLAPESLLRLGAHAGQMARIRSAQGEIVVRLREEEGLHPSVVVVERGVWRRFGGAANDLIEGHATDVPGGVAYYDQRVRIEVEAGQVGKGKDIDS